MKCAELQRHFDEYLDQECAPEIRELIDEHLTGCADCRAEMASRKAFHAAFAGWVEEELPCDFNAVFSERLAEEERRQPRRKPLYRRAWAKGVALAACLLLVVGVIGSMPGLFGVQGTDAAAMESGAAPEPAASRMANQMVTDTDIVYSKTAEAETTEEAPAEEMAVEESTSSYDAGEGAALPAVEPDSAVMERKIIKDWYISLEIMDYDVAFAALEELATRYGGYVVSADSYQSADSEYRDGWISLRVNAEQAEAAVAEIATLGVVESSSYSTSDVTSEYYDIEARLSQYQAQEERLLEMYDAAETVSDLVTIETELVRVQSEIESMEGRLRYYDQLTALSLIEISLYTPNPYTQTVEPQGWAGFVQNLREHFLRGINNLLDFVANLVYFLVSALPVLIILAVVIVVIVVLIRHRRHRRP